MNFLRNRLSCSRCGLRRPRRASLALLFCHLFYLAVLVLSVKLEKWACNMDFSVVWKLVLAILNAKHGQEENFVFYKTATYVCI